jgi:hypothetical protein
MTHRARSAPDDPDAAGKDSGKAVSGDDPSDSSPARPDSALRAERTAAYRANVDAVYRQYAIDHGYAGAERPEREPVTPAMRRIEAEGPEPQLVGPEDRLKGKGRLADAADLKKSETPQATDGGDCGDVPDDPRNYSNPKTGRFDASWSTYDRAIAAAREHTGGDLGPDSIKMYDHNPETGEGTGTLIGEQTPDRLRGWRIDGQDGHVNWWDWTEGKKGAGGVYGHDWFPEDPSTPGSRYIGWAPWQDSDGNIREGN